MAEPRSVDVDGALARARAALDGAGRTAERAGHQQVRAVERQRVLAGLPAEGARRPRRRSEEAAWRQLRELLVDGVRPVPSGRVAGIVTEDLTEERALQQAVGVPRESSVVVGSAADDVLRAFFAPPPSGR